MPSSPGMRMSRRTTSHASSAKSSSASRPSEAARTSWPSCSRRRRRSFRLMLSSSAMRMLAVIVVRDPRARAAAGQLGSRMAVTKPESPLDMRALDELRASVGDDPVFVAELIDEFVEEAPRQLEISARGGDDRRGRVGPTSGAHAQRERPHVRSRGARLAVPGGGDGGGGGRPRGRAPAPEAIRRSRVEPGARGARRRPAAVDLGQPNLAGVSSSAATSSSTRIGLPT